MFGTGGFGYDADDDRDYGESRQERRRRNRADSSNGNSGFIGDNARDADFADPRDAYGEQYRRHTVDSERNASYLSFGQTRIDADVDADLRQSPTNGALPQRGTADEPDASIPRFRPTRQQMDDLNDAIGTSSSSSSSSPVRAPPEPPKPSQKPAPAQNGATASSSSCAPDCSCSSTHSSAHSGVKRRRRRRKRRSDASSSATISSMATSDTTGESLGSATTTAASASAEEFLFSDEESPRARRRARKESQQEQRQKKQPTGADKGAAAKADSAVAIKYAALPQVRKANDERAYGAEMAHDIELDMDDSSCDELERELVGRRLREESLRAARAEEGYTQADRLRDQDSSASATDEVMAGRMRELNVRERQLFVSTDDESDGSKRGDQSKAAAKKRVGPDEILSRFSVPGTASAAGQAINCFVCGYTREDAPIVANKDLRQLLELFYNPNGSDLRRHARAVHVFYKTRIWRNAEWRQQQLPLWRTRDVYVCLTKHQMEPRLVIRKHLSMIDTLIESTVATAHMQAMNGQLVPHRDNLRLVDVLMNRYWNLARIDPSKTNFYQARATPTAHAPGPYTVQTVRARMTTSTATLSSSRYKRSRFY